MNIDWKTVDRWLMGEAFVGSCVSDHINALCDEIGVRWAGPGNEQTAAKSEFFGENRKDEGFPRPYLPARA